jgi:3-mercaptopyruvate sulfurtransferase SseA
MLDARNRSFRASDLMHNRFTVAVCFLMLVVGGAAASQTDDISSPKLRIVWDDFKKLYDDKAVLVVDVRGADAYAAGHIPGSRSIPLDEIGRHADELQKLNKPIVVYCA